MTARLVFQPDAAAHSAKNAHAAPGSHVQPQDRTEEAQMVATPELDREIANLVFTPFELNLLVSREIAARLREIAGTLGTNAAFLLANTTAPTTATGPRARVYLDVAAQLDQLARHELETAGTGGVTR